MMNYFIIGLILAVILTVLTGIVLKKFKDLEWLEIDDKDELAQATLIICSVVAVVSFVAWPLGLPIWILAFVIINVADHNYKAAKAKEDADG